MDKDLAARCLEELRQLRTTLLEETGDMGYLGILLYIKENPTDLEKELMKILEC